LKSAIKMQAFLSSVFKISMPAKSAPTRNSATATIGKTIFDFAFSAFSMKFSMRARTSAGVVAVQ
jgi:hypothetical protein